MNREKVTSLSNVQKKIDDFSQNFVFENQWNKQARAKYKFKSKNESPGHAI